jgi:hypothetical protein
MTRRGALLLAFVMTAATSSGADRRTLELVWMDPQGLFPDFEAVQSEADAVFADLGVSVRWEVGTAPRSSSADRDPVRIQVVLMPTEPSTWGLSPTAMGVVLLPDRRPQDSVFLFYRPILRNLGLGTKGDSMLRPGERRDVARALGRVVVHEVIHAVAPNLAHSDEGLMHDALLADCGA